MRTKNRSKFHTFYFLNYIVNKGISIEVDTLFKVDCKFFFGKKLEKMMRLNDLLEFLRTLMLSIIHNNVQIKKDTLSSIETCLQNAQDKIEFLELESQLQ